MNSVKYQLYSVQMDHIVLKIEDCILTESLPTLTLIFLGLITAFLFLGRFSIGIFGYYWRNRPTHMLYFPFSKLVKCISSCILFMIYLYIFLSGMILRQVLFLHNLGRFHKLSTTNGFNFHHVPRIKLK